MITLIVSFAGGFAIYTLCKIYMILSLMQVDVEMIKRDVSMQRDAMMEMSEQLYHMREKVE